MRILVIDDTKSALMLTCAYLNKMGHETLSASDGEEGLERYMAERPDLVLIDVVMPGLNGFEVTEKIRQMDGNDIWIPIIFLSAQVDDENIAKGIEAGGDDYLTKPISNMVLTAKIQAMERIYRMRQGLVELKDKLQVANARLAELSTMDGLTGIANRRAFDAELADAWKKAAHNQGDLALILLDVDFFKKYNDNYGHQQGDECLRVVAETLASAVTRSSDLVARYGGEEFAVIMPGTDIAGAEEIAERIRASIEARHLDHCASDVSEHVTVSLGVAMARPSREIAPWGLVQCADEALYQAKGNGRNCFMSKPCQAKN